MNDNQSFSRAVKDVVNVRHFDVGEMDSIAARGASNDVSGFLFNEGLSTYLHGFLWTTLPSWNDESLTEWELDPRKCHVFLRTALGALVYESEGVVCLLDPVMAINHATGMSVRAFLNEFVPSTQFLELTHHSVYTDKNVLAETAFDEMYAFVPAISLGGSFEESNLELVKMREHLIILAQIVKSTEF